MSLCCNDENHRLWFIRVFGLGGFAIFAAFMFLNNMVYMIGVIPGLVLYVLVPVGVVIVIAYHIYQCCGISDVLWELDNYTDQNWKRYIWGRIWRLAVIIFFVLLMYYEPMFAVQFMIILGFIGFALVQLYQYFSLFRMGWRKRRIKAQRAKHHKIYHSDHVIPAWTKQKQLHQRRVYDVCRTQ